MPASESEALTDAASFPACHFWLSDWLLFLNETNKMQPNVIDGSMKLAMSAGLVVKK